MRITATPRLWPRRSDRRVTLTVDSELGATILRMISTHSLSAFTPAGASKDSGTPVGPVAPADVRPVRSVTPTVPGIGKDGGSGQRTLDAVPPAPTRPLPRGSLVDLRI